MAMIMARVRRSRRIWMNSLRIIVRIRVPIAVTSVARAMAPLPLTAISSPLDAVEEDAQDGVLDRAAVEAQAKLLPQQISHEQMHRERSDEGLRRQHGMDGAQMLAGRMARQVCTHRAKE